MQQDQIQSRVKECATNAKLAQKGFTLLEVLVAVLILALAYIAVLQSFSLSLQSINKISSTRKALLEELLPFSESIRFKGLDLLADEKNEEVGTPFLEGEKYRLVIVKSKSGQLVTLKIQSNL